MIILDAKYMNEKEKAFSYLKEKLDFPEYFGNNLDALYDCLCELSCADILIKNICKTDDKDYFNVIYNVMEDAKKHNINLKITYKFIN